jgi:hypothetical protein
LSITGIDFGIADTTDFTTDELVDVALCRDISEEVEIVESLARRLTTDDAVTDVTEIPESLFVEHEIDLS